MNISSIWLNDIILEIHELRQFLAEEYQNDLYAYSQAAVSHCLSLGFEFAESPRRSPKFLFRQVTKRRIYDQPPKMEMNL